MNVPFTCATYNVRSLGLGKNRARKRCDIRQFIKNADPSPEVILLQEIHMGIKDCVASTSQLRFRRGKEFWNESKYSASTSKYNGGTSILVVERLIPYIADHGVIIGSRAQYITFRFSILVTIGIVNIYGYNQPVARARMWQSLLNIELPPLTGYGGDWNVVEAETDRSTSYIGTMMTRSERATWSEFLMTHDLRDINNSDDFSKSTPKHFT